MWTSENLAPPGFDPQAVQPIVSRYTDGDWLFYVVLNGVYPKFPFFIGCLWTLKIRAWGGGVLIWTRLLDKNNLNSISLDVNSVPADMYIDHLQRSGY